jgi:hypothetical protein
VEPYLLLTTCINEDGVQLQDRLCGLVADNPEVPGSIPGASRFSE